MGYGEKQEKKEVCNMTAIDVAGVKANLKEISERLALLGGYL